MVVETEGNFQIGDASLYTKTWSPDGPAKAKVLHIHGFSDHINRYNDFFRALATAGIEVYGFDQRGWGRSAPNKKQRGMTGPTTLVMSDIAAVLKSLLPCTVPLFVLGHSMGGGEALTFASTPKYEDLIGQVRGWILESPFIAFAPEEVPSAVTITAGRMVAKLLPKFQLVRVIPPANLSRDPAVCKSIKEDTLMHNTGTLEGLADLIQRTEDLTHRKLKLSKKVHSLILFHGSGDKVTSYPNSKDWYEHQAIEDGQFKTYEGWYHVLHGEPTKEEFFQDTIDWIMARLGPVGSEKTAAPAATTTTTAAPAVPAEAAASAGPVPSSAAPAEPEAAAAATTTTAAEKL